MLLSLPDHLLREILEFAVPRDKRRRWLWVQRIMGTCSVFRQIASEQFVPTIFDDKAIFADLGGRQQVLDPMGRPLRNFNHSELVANRQARRFILSFMTYAWTRQAIQELKLTSFEHDRACDEGLFQMLVTKGVLPNVKRIEVLLRPCLFQYQLNFFEEMSSAHGHQLEHLALLSDSAETGKRLPYNLFSYLAYLFPNLKSLRMREYGNNWVPVRPFYQRFAWRHLEKIKITGIIICNDLAAATGNLKYLDIEVAKLSGENLQAILVANPGLQVLRMRCLGLILHRDDAQIIGEHGKNLQRIYYFAAALDDDNLMDLVGEDSKLCTLDLGLSRVTLAGFRRLFLEKNPQFLGKGNGYIGLNNCTIIDSLKTAFPDCNWRYTSE